MQSPHSGDTRLLENDDEDRRRKDRRQIERRDPDLKEKIFKTGDIIFKQGDPGRCAYLLKSGSIEIFKTTQEGEKKSISILNGKAILGEMSLIEKSPHSVTAVALEESKLSEITEEQLSFLCKHKPQGLMIILKIVIHRLRATMDQVSKLEKQIKEMTAEKEMRKQRRRDKKKNKI